MCWLYVPGLEGLNSASSSPCPQRAASLTWRGKPRRPQSWCSAWKRVTWLRRLSGLTLPPSTLERGVVEFIASLPAIPASPTASPASAAAPPTIASSPTRCCASSMSAGLIVSSARTCRGMPTGSSPCSPRHWKGWATALRQEFSARPKPAIPTGESGSSSWPTARTARGGYTRDNGDPEKARPTLEGLAEAWMTPNVPNGGRTADHATVTGRTATHNGKKVQVGLEHQARRRPAGMASEQCQQSLTTLAVDFSRSSAPAPATPDGPTSSPPRRSLNPLFVEWLMRWPLFWTR